MTSALVGTILAIPVALWFFNVLADREDTRSALASEVQAGDQLEQARDELEENVSSQAAELAAVRQLQTDITAHFPLDLSSPPDPPPNGEGRVIEVHACEGLSAESCDQIANEFVPIVEGCPDECVLTFSTFSFSMEPAGAGWIGVLDQADSTWGCGEGDERVTSSVFGIVSASVAEIDLDGASPPLRQNHRFVLAVKLHSNDRCGEASLLLEGSFD